MPVLVMALILAHMAVVFDWSAVLLLVALDLRREFLPAAVLPAPWYAESRAHLVVLAPMRVAVVSLDTGCALHCACGLFHVWQCCACHLIVLRHVRWLHNPLAGRDTWVWCCTGRASHTYVRAPTHLPRWFLESTVRCALG